MADFNPYWDHSYPVRARIVEANSGFEQLRGEEGLAELRPLMLTQDEADKGVPFDLVHIQLDSGLTVWGHEVGWVPLTDDF